MPKDLTLEINANHPTIVNLNVVRKADPGVARDICMVFLDQVLTSSSIPYDLKESHSRTQRVMEAYLDESLALLTGKSSNTAEPIISDASFEPLEEHESILNQA